MAQNKKARQTNYNFKAGNKEGEKAKGIPKGKRDLNKILQSLHTQLKSSGVKMPYDTDPVVGALVWGQLKIATRDNDEQIEKYCETCGESHDISFSYDCPVNGKGQNVFLKIPNVQMEKNTIQAASTIFNRLFPTLQSVSGTINIEGKMLTMADAIGQIITEFVPGKKRLDCLQKIDEMISSVSEE